MAKEATLQVRMDADLKEQAEELYKKMGTSFAEAVRILWENYIYKSDVKYGIVIFYIRFFICKF